MRKASKFYLILINNRKFQNYCAHLKKIKRYILLFLNSRFVPSVEGIFRRKFWVLLIKCAALLFLKFSVWRFTGVAVILTVATQMKSRWNQGLTQGRWSGRNHCSMSGTIQGCLISSRIEDRLNGAKRDSFIERERCVGRQVSTLTVQPQRCCTRLQLTYI